MTDKADAFEHKGHKITVNASGKFTCKIGREEAARTTLAALRKYIDTKKKFTPFKGFDNNGAEYDVVGVEKTGKRRYEEYRFICEGTSRYWNRPTELVRDTPENRKILKEAKEWDRETDRIQEKRNKHHQKMIDRLTMIAAADFYKNGEDQ